MVPRRLFQLVAQTEGFQGEAGIGVKAEDEFAAVITQAGLFALVGFADDKGEVMAVEVDRLQQWQRLVVDDAGLPCRQVVLPHGLGNTYPAGCAQHLVVAVDGGTVFSQRIGQYLLIGEQGDVFTKGAQRAPVDFFTVAEYPVKEEFARHDDVFATGVGKGNAAFDGHFSCPVFHPAPPRPIPLRNRSILSL